MIQREPVIRVGVYEGYVEARGELRVPCHVNGSLPYAGTFHAVPSNGELILTRANGAELARGREIEIIPEKPTAEPVFLLNDVTIGVKFHWERKEDQLFTGSLRLVLRDNGTVTAMNEISVEEYLKSVISSEMSASAPLELLKAHAITSRSWLVAMLEKSKRIQSAGKPVRHGAETENEIVRWYDREDHDIYDVCADDHCQRYQGVTKIISEASRKAIETTRGVFLTYKGEICDARYYKACGGLTDEFENSWEDTHIPYLVSVSDAPIEHPRIRSEQDAEKWIRSSPDAYCNTTDGNILRQILPSFDQETTDFFRWKVTYSQSELAALIKEKSGIDFGGIKDLVPIRRGPSGRIVALKLVGTKRTVTVGKDLEIRKWLSKSHLYSSAFVVKKQGSSGELPASFTLYGAGWGHGVGLCQIGAAVMAVKGFKAEEIVKHYFPGAELQKVY